MFVSLTLCAFAPPEDYEEGKIIPEIFIANAADLVTGLAVFTIGILATQFGLLGFLPNELSWVLLGGGAAYSFATLCICGYNLKEWVAGDKYLFDIHNNSI